ncbi:MAG: DUF4091 domain-containing protein [Chloroflexota bacterium]
MIRRTFSILVSFIFVLILLLSRSSQPAQANAPDAWWDEGWPYRIPVTVSGSGVAQANINFTTAFAYLGLNGALLDVRSLRVVPYVGTSPAVGGAIPYEETYSDMLENADSPQIGWHPSGVYWRVNDGSAVADNGRFSQGTGSLKATIINTPGGYGYPGVEMIIASGQKDWRSYETFIYDVWPEVNASAQDQAPDLYSFKLYNTSGCSSSNITQGGPALALDQWNRATVSLKPFHTCTTPNFNDISRLEFHTRDNDTVNGNSGLWDDGDELRLWFDNIRLVDQDSGAIKWTADGSTTHYYIYFDVIEHEGHPLPATTTLGGAVITATVSNPEAGGYYHKISGASTGSLAIWSAPPIEKILKTNAAPTATAPLRIQAAKDEFEPLQLVVRSPSTQNLPVSISSFSDGSHTIPAANVTLHRVDYVPLTRLSDDFGRLGEWPDPLYPVQMGANVSFPANINQPLWFTVHVPRDATAGLYQATVTIGSAAIPVELEVWNFTLPPEIHLEGEWGFGWSNVVETYKGTNGGVQPGYWTLVDALYEDFADHRLTPKGVGWPAGLNYPGGVEYDCNGLLEPDAWGIWGFGSLAGKYLDGAELDDGAGFPSLHIKGPSSNWPPDSRPSSFCGVSRGTDPTGNPAYNAKWFQYWTAVSNYVNATSNYADKGYYHIVNEPQTFADYDIVAYLAQQTKAAAPHVRILVSEQVEPYIYNNPTYPGAKIDIWMPTISNYQVVRAHDRQQNHGEDVWWYFLYGDHPPLPNPTVMDRTGMEARITPWLAWLERVEGLVYYSTTDWSPNPWSQPWINDGNGDGFLFYPPKDGTIAFDAGNAQSNRLVPSIRWELMREGMEDYEYLWLLNEGDPQIGQENQADVLARQFIASRTLFSRVPTDLYATRAAIAAELAGLNPSAAKTAKTAVSLNETFDYTLTYYAGESAHSVTITDNVPAGTTVLSASGSKPPNPAVNGQAVSWAVAVGSGETVTLTIEARGDVPGLVENTAVFSGQETLQASTQLMVYTHQVFLPLAAR